MRKFKTAAIAAVLFAIPLASAHAESTSSPGFWSWFSGDYSLTLGGAGFVAPRYEGSKDMHLSGMPMISFGRRGSVTKFSSINDSASFAIYDNGFVRFGPTGKLVLPRDDSASHDLHGLHDVPWGVEAGAFLDLYPSDWLRFRTELRQSIGGHHGFVADFAADAFTDLTPTLRLSGGPRLSAATKDYFDAYYGVDAAESLASGLGTYSPGGGFRDVGFGGALTWQATDKITTSLFAEYSRLLGPAADSTLVKQRGSDNQLLVGVSATYRFDFSM